MGPWRTSQRRWGLAPRIVLGDSAFGDATEFRDALDERGCPYLVAISGEHLTWPPGSHPHKPRRKSKTGRPPSQFVDDKRKPLAISEVAQSLDFRKVTIVGSRGNKKSGYVAFERVHLAERHTKGQPLSEQVWLISEWRPAKREYRYYVCNLPASTTKRELVRLVKLRWRIERDYQAMKQEIGLDHFEGRTWRGFHHHVTLCAVAHGFLAIQRQLFPPEDLPMDAAHGPKAYSTSPAFADR